MNYAGILSVHCVSVTKVAERVRGPGVSPFAMASLYCRDHMVSHLSYGAFWVRRYHVQKDALSGLAFEDRRDDTPRTQASIAANLDVYADILPD